MVVVVAVLALGAGVVAAGTFAVWVVVVVVVASPPEAGAVVVGVVGLVEVSPDAGGVVVGIVEVLGACVVGGAVVAGAATVGTVVAERARAACSAAAKSASELVVEPAAPVALLAPPRPGDAGTTSDTISPVDSVPVTVVCSSRLPRLTLAYWAGTGSTEATSAGCDPPTPQTITPIAPSARITRIELRHGK